ncbi:MAG TPA: squalene--hopene cyclase [Micromonosporaceae bacterium]|jgi:squalene-hopene/tetraprenyl-beta-curcumene cyclase
MTRAASGARPAVDADAAAALDRAVGHLRRLQHANGWWKGDLATNVTMDAEDLLMREFLGIRTAIETEESARWIRSQQRDDGTWATFHGGPGDLSTTVEAWVALRLAGDDPGEPHMDRAAAFIRDHGGLAATRVFTRMWLALFGAWSWDDLPDLPPELIYLPKWFPLNIYDWACWARQTVVPLTIVCSLRPVRPLPFSLDAVRAEAPPPHRSPLWTWSGVFQRLDRVLHWYSRHAVMRVRDAARRRGAEWIIARQEADGCWGGIQPPWVYSLLALHLLGYGLDHPVVAKGLAGLDGFTVRERAPEGERRWLEACQSPVWDTALATTALLDAGVRGDDPAVVRAVDWLVGEEITVTGDWSVRRPRLAPGGWAFEFANDVYPDTDDTAEVVLALARGAEAHPDRATVLGAVERGVAWTIGMQSRDGGWGAFDADNTSTLPARLPFCDFGAVVDPPSADVTAHIVEMLCAQGLGESRACQRGVAWLLRHQEPDGSWFGRWGANFVYGTGAVVPALVAAGFAADSQQVRRGVDWLRRHQNDDGGWGEDLRSYDDPAWAGRGTSTASQTAWALLALHAAGARDEAAQRGLAYLVATQRDDGTWDEEAFTGTGFPGDFFINYGLYRLVFPITALGRYVRSQTSGWGG